LDEGVARRLPFHRNSQFEIMQAHMSELPQAPSIVNQEVPAELSEIILTAMAKDPASRFQTAEEFQRRVDRLRGAGQPATQPSVPRADLAASEVAGTPLENFANGTTALRRISWRLVAAGLFTFLVVLTLLALARRF
jgi:serine/threonine-protein kinase